LGLPEEISFKHKNLTNIFGFSDTSLSAEIENAFQALAINETRADFVSTGISFVQTEVTDHGSHYENCCKFQQTEEGRSKNQKLKQVSMLMSVPRKFAY